jgi:hypothetical protein
MTHSHDKTNLDFAFAYEALQASEAGVFQPSAGISDKDYEDAWSNFVNARNEAATASQSQLARVIKDNLPSAEVIVIYEDRTHDAPHGHLEGVLDSDGKLIIAGTTDKWHDLEWTTEADEIVWDLYYLGSHLFNLIAGKRRMIIDLRHQ